MCPTAQKEVLKKGKKMSRNGFDLSLYLLDEAGPAIQVNPTGFTQL